MTKKCRFQYIYNIFNYLKLSNSGAVYFANSILNGGKEAVERYINYLKAGCSKFPLEILKDAGVDILNGTVINKALEEFSNKLEVLKTLWYYVIMNKKN